MAELVITACLFFFLDSKYLKENLLGEMWHIGVPIKSWEVGTQQMCCVSFFFKVMIALTAHLLAVADDVELILNKNC